MCMGRHDSYSYYSEAGGVQGESTPGEDRESRRPDKCCSCCGEEKPSVVERSGSFSNELLCDECVEKKQNELDRQRSRSVLEDIR